ncbi:MAG: GNAT family N-acetyltransferase [Phycisphaeraceae bacterium]|nr:GNAT family N-acetyltransferase [Phycisphaeraceae bacterium]
MSENWTLRRIEKTDIPALFIVRVATRENALSMETLNQLGITLDSVATMMDTTHQGWLCEMDNKVVGFAMGNRKTGEMWVLAVLPEYENRGMGKALILAVENWLFSEGLEELWLTTDIDTTLRAYGFYRHLGWQDSEIRDGCRYMKKFRPQNA